MLTAAIRFLVEEIGIHSIFYHSFTTGAAIKRIRGQLPPKSLYTSLPRQFCFEPVAEAPSFIANHRRVRKALRKIKNPQWFYLEI